MQSGIVYFSVSSSTVSSAVDLVAYCRCAPPIIMPGTGGRTGLLSGGTEYVCRAYRHRERLVNGRARATRCLDVMAIEIVERMMIDFYQGPRSARLRRFLRSSGTIYNIKGLGV